MLKPAKVQICVSCSNIHHMHGKIVFIENDQIVLQLTPGVLLI